MSDIIKQILSFGLTATIPKQVNEDYMCLLEECTWIGNVKKVKFEEIAGDNENKKAIIYLDGFDDPENTRIAFRTGKAYLYMPKVGNIPFKEWVFTVNDK